MHCDLEMKSIYGNTKTEDKNEFFKEGYKYRGKCPQWAANIEDWNGSRKVFQGGETQWFNPNASLTNIKVVK